MASILGAFQAAQTSANRANLARYKEGIGIYDQIISRYGKEGGFVKGQTAQLERTKKKDIASGMQSMVSSGLAGSTAAAGLPGAWEEDVGAGARLNIADVAGQRMSQAQLGKAGFIERRQDTGPDPSLVSSLMQGMGRSEGAGASDPYGPGGYLRDPWKKSPATYAAQRAHQAKMNAPSISSTARRTQQPTSSAYSQKPYFSRWGQSTRAIPQGQRTNIARTLT